MNASPIGIFGGTFDPIHFGHLRTGFELLQVLQLGELRWIPAGNPGHRGVPLADASLRLDAQRQQSEDGVAEAGRVDECHHTQRTKRFELADTCADGTFGNANVAGDRAVRPPAILLQRPQDRLIGGIEGDL